jgi:hypothetical protein
MKGPSSLPRGSTRLAALGLAWVLASTVACVSVPVYRPPVELPATTMVEVGVAPQLTGSVEIDDVAGSVTPEVAIPGGAVWGAFRTPANVDVIAGFQASPAIALQGDGYTGTQFGGQLGVRYRFPQLILEDMRFSTEGVIEYLQDDYSFGQATGDTRRHLSFIGRIPVAQQAFEGVWVYTALTVGLSIPIYPNPPAPFFGIFEAPLGITWQPLPWLTLLAEGGASKPLIRAGNGRRYGGGYLGVGAQFQL